MKARLKTFLFSQFMLLLLAPAIHAQLSSLHTKNLRLIYYSKGHEYVVKHLARCFENSLQFHRTLFDYRPKEQIALLLEDFGDYGNAGADAVPKNFIAVGIAPPSYIYETAPANERMISTMHHELVHIVALDKPSASDKFFRSIFFGKVNASSDNPITMIYSYLTTPRRSSPRWYHEGIAVFLETWMSGGIGRALGAYDEMVFRSMVRDNSYIYDVVGLEAEGKTIDFQVGVNSYLYGTRFMSYLAYQHGPQKLLEWISRTDSSRRYFASQFKNVYKVSLDNEWSKWIEHEHKFQQANLDSIRLYPTTGYRPITHTALGSVSRAYYDSSRRRIYTAIRYPGQVAHIAAIDLDTGATRKIRDVKGAALFYVTSLAFDQSSNSLFYTTDNNKWRDLNVVNIKTRKSRTLIKDVRTGDLTFNRVDKSIWGVRHFNGISTLVRIPHPYIEWNQIYSFPYGSNVFDIDISPDGTKLTSALAEVDGTQQLIQMDTRSLLKGEKSYDVLFDFEISTPANFTFSPDGRYVYGSSYFSGVSNIYRYDFDKKDMDIISNCETGFFRPVPISEDSLLVFRYTGKGFVPVMIPNQIPEHVSAIKYLGDGIAKKYSLVRSWALGSPASVNIDSLTSYTGDYSTFANIKLASAYPVVQGYKDFASIGMRFNFLDRIGLSGLDLTAAYSPDADLPSDERVHFQFNFKHWNWRLTAKYNAGDFYDLFGPTKTSRKGYSLGISHKKNLVADQPKSLDLELSVAGYANMDRLPHFQNIIAPFDKLLTFGASLQYEFVRKSLGAVDEEKGVRWQLTSGSNFVNSELFPRLYSTLDYGVALPLNHSSIWFRGSAGHSLGERANPFANFFFGGFGNNHVDFLTEKRYREYYTFPGTELNQIGGKNFGKLLAEWNLPPIRFRRVGFPSLYFNWARIALFTSAIHTNFDNPVTRRTFFNVGGQIDFRLVLFSNLSSTLSFGYAAALPKGRPVKEAATEFMFSLKIL